MVPLYPSSTPYTRRTLESNPTIWTDLDKSKSDVIVDLLCGGVLAVHSVKSETLRRVVGHARVDDGTDIIWIVYMNNFLKKQTVSNQLCSIIYIQCIVYSFLLIIDPSKEFPVGTFREKLNPFLALCVEVSKD